jgi:chorismate--pyruvate lyase
MNKEYQSYSNFFGWQIDNAINVSRVPEQYQPWLVDRGSLTSALIALSDNNFRVKLLKQEIAIPKWHEQKKLNRAPHRAAMVREVELLLYDEPVVYARSIIPMALAQKGKSSLAGLGTTPLGYFLFNAGKIRISKRQIAIISEQGESHYARRTPYDYQGQTVLVSEFFLPAFDKYL